MDPGDRPRHCGLPPIVKKPCRCRANIGWHVSPLYGRPILCTKASVGVAHSVCFNELCRCSVACSHSIAPAGFNLTSSTGTSEKREIPTSSTIKHYQLHFELYPDGLDSCSATSDLRDTTIDKHFRSRDVTAVISREKYRDLSDLIGCAEPA